MRLPRFLWVPFELGRPFGAPHEADFQRRVLEAALTLLERNDGPVVLEDFPDDAPRTADDATAWSCPVSFVASGHDQTDAVEATRQELGQLAPWAELSLPPTPNSGRSLGEIVDLLAAAARGHDVAVQDLRLAADDAHTWYLHAAAQQPGRATSHDRNTWFWRDTALARLIGRVARRLLDHPDPTVRTLGHRGLVPRDHWDLLVRPLPNGAPDA
ncbi:MAG: hypothetical protein RIB98_16980 [Acidimicrobiales bacterium]